MHPGTAVGYQIPATLIRHLVSEPAIPSLLSPAQLNPATGPPEAFVGTFLLATAFYAVTAHIAARYVLGDVPFVRAARVGPVPALVGLALQQWGPAVVIAVSVVVDYVAIRYSYRLSLKMAGAVSLIHYTVSAIAGITVFNLVRLLGTMPG
ncbi:MAG: hypothetical protein R3324_15775 [Halobacteriales archaeon]|nr:hypothetical protein [Halobacteriales archaeon]